MVKKNHTHDYISRIKKPATCTEPGIMVYTCKNNDDSYEEEIPETGHENKITKFVKKAACNLEGYTGDIYCQDCGRLLEEGRVIPKLDHVWNSGNITKQPTSTETGVKTYTCRNCGTTRTETIAKLKPQKATPGKSVKDQSSNGVYKVLEDGLSVEFTKPLSKRTMVKVPDTIKVNGIICKVTGIAANAFKNNTSLENVMIGKHVTVVGANAFYGCKNLTKVSGGNSIVKFGDRSFANCGSLGSIAIPGTTRSIGNQAFYNCKKLRSITIKTSTLSGKTIGSKAFVGTYKKPTVKVPAKQMKSYKKLLTSRGMNSKAVYKK
ncbi:MAG: leucine-rich repeat domain-containing protein [bacterium]|nr:leucine-rich repeat domain-containing protein [bacterium]